jgi:CheY-like chemotaxis protein
MALDRILLVDDESNVLDGYRRSLRGQFHVTTAKSGQEALEKLETEADFAVIVSDMRMPEMSGVELLKRVKVLSPDSTRMMLTGNADQETAIQAVNQGHIFRFLSKPCQPQTFTIALAMGVRQYKLVTAEKELLEKTLKGSVEVLMHILSLSDPEAFAASERVRYFLHLTADELGIENPWTLEVAVMLSPIGFLTLPPELKGKINSNAPLSGNENQILSSVPDISARLLSNIPRLEDAAELVRCGVERRRSEVSSFPKLSEDMSSGLGVVRLFYDLVQRQQSGFGVDRALEDLKQGGCHDGYLLERVSQALQHVLPSLFSEEYVVLELALKKITKGDELFEDVMSEDDRLLLTAGTRITGPFLERLANYRKLVGIKEPIKVKRFLSRNSTNSSSDATVSPPIKPI